MLKVVCMMSLKVWKKKKMNKILKKDIVRLCNCIQGLSYHNIITWYNIKPYNCKEVHFLFYKDDHEIVLNADNKKEMYIKLLELYESGLNSWIELYNNDRFKSKREKKRMNYYINKLNEFERLLND